AAGSIAAGVVTAGAAVNRAVRDPLAGVAAGGPAADVAVARVDTGRVAVVLALEITLAAAAAVEVATVALAVQVAVRVAAALHGAMVAAGQAHAEPDHRTEQRAQEVARCEGRLEIVSSLHRAIVSCLAGRRASSPREPHVGAKGPPTAPTDTASPAGGAWVPVRRRRAVHANGLLPPRARSHRWVGGACSVPQTPMASYAHERGDPSRGGVACQRAEPLTEGMRPRVRELRDLVASDRVQGIDCRKSGGACVRHGVISSP